MWRPRAATSVATSTGELAVRELGQRPLSVGLAQVAVDGGRPDALLPQVLHQPVGAALGADEEQRLLLAPADGGGHLHLVHLVHLEEPVLHQRHGLGGRRHLVVDGVGQVALDEAIDGTVEGGREEQRLVGLVQPAQHPLDLGHESHVGHAVGLVEHQRLERVHRDLAPVAEVDQPARGGDDEVDPLAQLGHLAVDVGAAVDGDGPQPELLGQRGEDVVHLHRELTGRQQDECQRSRRAGGRDGAVCVPGGPGPLQERHAEGEGLARAGLGLAAHVTAGQRVGDGQGLNWKSADDAFIGQRLCEFG